MPPTKEKVLECGTVVKEAADGSWEWEKGGIKFCWTGEAGHNTFAYYRGRLLCLGVLGSLRRAVYHSEGVVSGLRLGVGWPAS
jgi:hypothetical protein